MSIKTIIAGFAIVASLVLAGCGGNSEQAAIKQRFNDLHKGVVIQDKFKVCIQPYEARSDQPSITAYNVCASTANHEYKEAGISYMAHEALR